MIKKSLDRMYSLQQNNLKHYIRIIDHFVACIKRQGKGCNVKDHGAAYYNNNDKSFDPFGMTLGFEAIRKHYGLISAEEQKPLIQKMSRKFKVNCETDKEYSSFVIFLQELQDIHDFSFDQYYSVDGDRMLNYFNKMKEIKEKCTNLLDTQ